MIYDRSPIISPGFAVGGIVPTTGFPVMVEYNLELLLLLEYIAMVMYSIENLNTQRDGGLPLNVKILLQRLQTQLKDLQAEAGKFQEQLETAKDSLPPALKPVLRQLTMIQKKIDDVLKQLQNFQGKTSPNKTILFEELDGLHQMLYELKGELQVLLQQIPPSQLEELRQKYQALFPRGDEKPKNSLNISPPTFKTEAKELHTTAQPNLMPEEELEHILDLFLRIKTIELAQTKEGVIATPQTPLTPATPLARTEATVINLQPVFSQESVFPLLEVSTKAEVIALLQAMRETPILIAASNPELAANAQAMQNNNDFLPLGFIVPFPYVIPPEVKLGQKVEEKQEEETEEGPEKQEQKQNMVVLPGGDVLIADTPVTNGQFATWLNRRYKEGRVALHQRGQIKDEKGALLCVTNEGHPSSQIQIGFLRGSMFFKAMRGLERNPVVLVTYFGAKAFCEDNGMRLPTEIEWRRAAGSYDFGCSVDEIDESRANYDGTLTAGKAGENRSTPVGFFNGASVFIKNGRKVQTKRAMSPCGCYDLSGNVREWVEPWDDSSQKVVKGGSYNSSIAELKISERVLLDPYRADPYTGFRPVMSL